MSHKDSYGVYSLKKAEFPVVPKIGVLKSDGTLKLMHGWRAKERY
jgi:hypothetical protein